MQPFIVETKTTLKVVRTGVKRVLIYSKTTLKVVRTGVKRVLIYSKTTLKVVRTGVKRVLIYSKIEKATLCSLPWTQAANFISKGTILCSYLPATA